MKIYPKTSKLMSGEILISKNQIKSCNIYRDTYINVDVLEYRYFQRFYHAYLNRYPSTHNYNYPYYPEYMEILQCIYIDLCRVV